MKIVAKTEKFPGGGVVASLIGFGEDGIVDRAMTDTLLDLVSLCNQKLLADLVRLVDAAQNGEYVPDNPNLPDWGINDVNVWLLPPVAEPGKICVTNENISQYSFDYGGAGQQYSYSEFNAVARLWEQFLDVKAAREPDRGEQVALEFELARGA